MTAPSISGALFATKTHSMAININKIITTHPPINPNSSPITAKIKSVCGSEIKLPFLTDAISLLFKPFPVNLPEPMAILPLVPGLNGKYRIYYLKTK